MIDVSDGRPMKLLDVDFPGHFCAVPWSDPVVEAVGFGFDHAYVELLWLPVVGPSSTWIFRRLGDAGVAEHPDGVDIDLAELSNIDGIGRRGRLEPRPCSDRCAACCASDWPRGKVVWRCAQPSLRWRPATSIDFPASCRLIHQSLVGGRCGGLVAQRPDPT